MSGAADHSAQGVPADQEGARFHTLSLLTLFLGIPTAFILASLWGLAVGTEDVGGDPDVTAWRAVLYSLPGTALVLVVTITSVWFAARAWRAGVYGAKAGLWLTSAGVFAVVWVLGMGQVNAVVQPYSSALHWVVRLVAAASGATAFRLARRGGGGRVAQ